MSNHNGTASEAELISFLKGAAGLVAFLAAVGLVVRFWYLSDTSEAELSNSSNVTDIANDTVAPVGATTGANGNEQGVQRYIAIRNKCDKAVKLWITYNTPVGWKGSIDDNWIFSPKQFSRITHNGALVSTSDPDVYFYATGPGLVWDGPHSKGTLGKLRKQTMVIDGDGDFVMTLRCS